MVLQQQQEIVTHLVVAAALSVLKMRRGVVVSALDFTCGDRAVGLRALLSSAAEFLSLPLLLLADKYEVSCLRQSCLQFMMDHVVQSPDTNRALTWYQYAQVSYEEKRRIVMISFMMMVKLVILMMMMRW